MFSHQYLALSQSVRFVGFLAVAFSLYLASICHAQPIGPDDLIVSDHNLSPSGQGGVVRVNRITASQSIITQGGNFGDVFGITYESPNTVLVVDAGFGNGRLIRVDVTSGQQTVLAIGLGHAAGGVAVAPNGDIFVPDDGFGGPGGIFRVSAAGQVAMVSPGGRPGSVVVHPDGYIYFSGHTVGVTVGGIARLDPASWQWTPILVGNQYNGTLAVAPDGALIVAVSGTPALTDNSIRRIDLSNLSNPTVLSFASNTRTPRGLWVDPDGTIFVGDGGDSATDGIAGIFRLAQGSAPEDPLIPVSIGGSFRNLVGLTGSPTSTPGSAPVIVAQPQSRIFETGRPAALAVSATGTGPLTYQWRKNGAAIDGATGAVLALGAAIPSLAGAYDVVVTSGSFSTTSASADVSIAPARMGTVTAWGNNDHGQIIVPPGLNDITAIDAEGGYHTAGLRADGTIVVWGRNAYGERNVPAGLSGVTAVAAGGEFTLALKADGTVVGWGGSGASVPAGLTGVRGIAGGQRHALAVKHDGTVVAWGEGIFGKTTVPAGLRGVVAVSAAANHSVALKNDGTVVAWGLNDHQQTNVPPGLNGVIAIDAGGIGTVALRYDGTLVYWGADGTLSVPAGVGVASAASAGGGWVLALLPTGEVVGWGNNDFGQGVAPAGLNRVIAVTTGVKHSVALVYPDSEAPIAIDTLLDRSAVAESDASTPITVSAWIDDRLTGASRIASAEFSITVDGNTVWRPMAAVDSQFDNSYEQVVATFTLASVGISTQGVYTVRVRGYDAAGNVSNEDSALLAVYDPSAGFVTGAGWIMSPVGAFRSDPALTGKAHFGFNSKYRKGASVPTGATHFYFSAADLNFESTSFEWLVVNEGGSNAQFKGTGTINGAGTYQFMIWASDGGNGGVDRLRVRISGPGGLVYDNDAEAPIGAGSVVVHTPKK